MPVEPGSSPSATRTAFFSGSTYVRSSFEGNSDVRQVVAPTVTSTRIEPNPAAVRP